MLTRSAMKLELFFLVYLLANYTSCLYFWFVFLSEHHWQSSLLLSYRFTLVQVVVGGSFQVFWAVSRSHLDHSQNLMLFHILRLKLLCSWGFYIACAYFRSVLVGLCRCLWWNRWGSNGHLLWSLIHPLLDVRHNWTPIAPCHMIHR